LYLTLLVASTSFQDVRLELAKEDSISAAQGEISPHTTSLTSFLTIGLDLEEQQYVLNMISYTVFG
jgi:hypothetical protein